MSSEDSFRTAMSASGIEYGGELYFDSRLHRFKAEGDNARNSWFVLYPGPPAAGAYGCWKRDLKKTWCERNGSLSSLELDLIRQRWREAKAKLKAETVARQEKARKVAAWILNRSRPARNLHRHLSGKRVNVFGNVRQYRRSLVLPLRDFSGELQSLQFIDGDGTKKFLTGGRIAGCFFTLADKTDGPLVICEGYATGASIHEATGHSVICCMNCGNLLEVAKAARERWRQREIIIAADNDRFTDGNPGLTKATAAAKTIRAKLAVPQFKDIKNKPTDFNDLATGESLDAVREQIGAAREETQQLPKAALTEKGAMKNVDDYIENDGGNAQMFVDRHSAVVRYIHPPIESWYIWDGNRWRPDAVEDVHQLARRLSNELVADSVKEPGRRDERKLRRGIAIGNRKQISSMLWLARSDPRIVIRREQIDADDFLLGVRNGVVDLRTGQRRDGQKGDFITKSCGCDYDATATAPRWRAFLDEIFEGQTDLPKYMQRGVGYTLTGDAREQCVFFLYGLGANGKSTFIEILMELLGDYGTTASQNILCFNKHVREPLDEIASLAGARFVSIAETGGSPMAEVRIKQLTGGDTVTGKAHYQKAVSFRPKFKLWIFGNSRPSIYGVDYAMWRRIKLIPFNVQFPIERQDPTLKEQLLGELPGILNWAIEGALAWQKEGRQIPPECVIQATQEYQADEDVLREFIAEKIEPAKEQKLAHSDLYRAYKDWHVNGSPEKPFSSKKIAQMFRDRGYKSFSGTDRKVFWWAIALKPESTG